MYSPSSSSESSMDSYDRQRHRRSHRPKSRKALHSKFADDDDGRYSKETRKLSPTLSMKHKLHDDTKHRSYRTKHSSSSRGKESIISRSEQIKREHDEDIKSVLKFLEKESSLNVIEDEKREEICKLKRQHKKEVKKMFAFLETELTLVTENHARKQAELEDILERTQVEADEELRRYKEHSLILEEELQTTTNKSMNETKKLKGELSTALKLTSSLEDEVQALRKQVAEKDKCIRQMEEKSNAVEELRDDVRRKDDEIRRKDQTIIQKNEEIRLLSTRTNTSYTNKTTSSYTKTPTSQALVENININRYDDWEETASTLTSYSDSVPFDVRKESPEMKYRNNKPPLMKYGQHSSSDVADRARKKSYSTSLPNRRDTSRDDLESRKSLSVSFSDEIEQRMLPMQESLSRRLEKMYMKK